MPVEPNTLVAFSFVALAIVVSPGPDTLLILRHSLVSSRAAGLATVLGVQLGLCTHTALAAVGISALIASSAELLGAMSIAGALYLAWIGVRAITERGAFLVAAAEPVRAVRACRDGALCNLLNPKVLILFLALYPSFLTLQAGVAAQIAILSFVLISLNTAWQLFLVLVARLARPWFDRPSTRRALDLASGGAFLLVAAAMLLRQLV